MDWDSTWVEIFRAGDYGQKGIWTEEDLDKVVSNFSSDHKAPLVLGHPKENSPAMGWVGELARRGITLAAKFSQVQPELEQLMQSGRFPMRSAAFYQDPQGKGPVLRHVGFLGGMPPEVKGLAPIKFSSSEFTEINFQEETAMDKDETKKTIKEEIKAFFSELFGHKESTPVGFSESQVKDIVSQAVAAATAPLIEQNKTLTTAFAEINNKLAASGLNSVKARVVADIARLKSTNKWVPAYDAQGMAAFMEATALAGTEVTFGETGKETKVSSYDALLKFLEAQNPIVPIKGITTGAKTSIGDPAHFNEAGGRVVDLASIPLNNLALKIEAEEKVDFGEALSRARAKIATGVA
jgi:hypothetical protein